MADEAPQDSAPSAADSAPADDTAAATDGTQEPATGDLGEAGKRAIEAERQRARELERELKALRRTVEQERNKGLSEAERAVAEAEARGRTAATTEFGKRLARSEFTAAAARRNPGYAIADALEYVDLSRLVSDDGEPDGKAIQAAVERLVPEPLPAGSNVPSFDGGTRVDAKSTDMNDVIRRAAAARR